MVVWKACQKLPKTYHSPASPQFIPYTPEPHIYLAPGTTQVCFINSAGLRVTLLVKIQWKTFLYAEEFCPLRACGLGLWSQQAVTWPPKAMLLKMNIHEDRGWGPHTQPGSGEGVCTHCGWKCPLHYLCSWEVLLCPGLCLCLLMPGLSQLCSAMFCGEREKTSFAFGKDNLRRRRRLVIWVAVGIWLNWRTEDCDQGGRRWLCGEGFGDAIQDSALDSHLHRGCCFTVHW